MEGNRLLGLFYKYGCGTKRNRVKAKELLSQVVAETGHEFAKRKLVNFNTKRILFDEYEKNM